MVKPFSAFQGKNVFFSHDFVVTRATLTVLLRILVALEAFSLFRFPF